ncbi:hypothetical protein MIND_01169600 [Mycena indigotica]|uniref:Uncharacterized protein n=1 Tax=Mycena indigotica TaxID=2126181 RepID=A0A8H6VWH6_9AGAR|nr:uncharacterized protein MIND_01169600 [Mycena indigotica]KAF7292713.1 hypothetical protein MIND_01169600 [Mycena indigotica]
MMRTSIDCLMEWSARVTMQTLGGTISETRLMAARMWGEPGSQFGVLKMTGRASDRDMETPKKTQHKRHSSSAASALRSIRRSLTMGAARWRKDEEKDGPVDNAIDDEPVLVSRPTSIISDPVRPEPSGTPKSPPKSDSVQVASKNVKSPRKSSTSKPDEKAGTLSFSVTSSLAPASGVKLRSNKSQTVTRRSASEQPHSRSSLTWTRSRSKPLPTPSRESFHTPIFDKLHTVEPSAHRKDSSEMKRADPIPTAAPSEFKKADPASFSSSRRHSSDVRSGSTRTSSKRTHESRRQSVPLASKPRSKDISASKSKAESPNIPPAPPKQT